MAAPPRAHDLKECAGCACFAIRRAARIITQHYDQALRESGLRVTQFTLLTMLALGGPLPVRRVADRLGMERTTLTRNLKPLIANGLISVDQGDDRRVRAISLTNKGHQAAVAAVPAWRRAQHAVAGQMSGGTFAALAAVTERLSTDRAQRARAQRGRRRPKETRT